MKAKAHIQAGICGFETDVLVDSPSMFEKSQLEINSTCPNIQKLTGELQTVDGMEETRHGQEGKIFTEARKIKKICANCIVPAGIHRAVMIANGMALPKDVVISLSKED